MRVLERNGYVQPFGAPIRHRSGIMAGMRITMDHREPGVSFTAASAERQVGRSVPVRIGEREDGEGLVVGAEVIEDGAGLRLTVEVTGPAADALRRAVSPDLNSWSIGTKPAPRS